MTFEWETREQWGALPPRLPLSSNINPVDGSKIHYGGAGPFKRADHAGCREIFRAWQRMHQADRVNNYSDLAYNLGACHHGVLMEGRSTQDRPRIRSGANGNSALNGRAFAIVAIWGALDGEPPQTLLETLAGGVAFMRASAGAGVGVYGHRDGWSTSCPGDALYARLPDIRRIADEGVTTPPPVEKIAATYNTPHRLGPANLLPDLERLRDEHAVTLIAVQECTDDDVPWYGKALGWDWWRPTRAQSAGLLFDPDAWLPVRRKDGERRQGSYRLHTPGVKTPPRWVVWADLEHAATGEVHRPGAYHLVAFKTRSPRAAKEYLRQQGRLARWLRNGPRRVALGDLNGSRSRFWTPALKRDAVWAEPFLPTYGKATIDHVLRPKGQPQPQTLAAVDGHSDHRALIVRL